MQETKALMVAGIPRILDKFLKFGKGKHWAGDSMSNHITWVKRMFPLVFDRRNATANDWPQPPERHRAS
ncbi:hypothetical protein K470DRAFT_255055 [Piedraia hortae CBS 480.64]|uniref:Uncharacterized protein n=1 Tax=Piedraia hortae CBS 480.64 TaxID=1314780 RepID=A0A6A7C708_9PEZI|nr:hypothetical protein K470DRAFT_255055 [Piedraia hortae CBS 480.64]